MSLVALGLVMWPAATVRASPGEVCGGARVRPHHFALNVEQTVTSKSEAIRMLVRSGIGAGLALAVLAEISVRLNGNGGAPSAPGWR